MSDIKGWLIVIGIVVALYANAYFIVNVLLFPPPRKDRKDRP